MKIQIIGYSGSGKSTLARKLGEKYGLSVLHLDSVQFLPNWEIRPTEDKQRIVEEFLDANDGWVVDGNYAQLSFMRRLREADEIIIMDFGRITCLWRAIKRYYTYKNTTRPDMGEGCNEKLDWAFVKWILWESRTKKSREGNKKLAKHFADKVRIIKNQRRLDRYYAEKGI